MGRCIVCKMYHGRANSQYCSRNCQQRANRGSRSLAIRPDGREFIGVDGEGVTDRDGSHRYVLLGVGKRHISAPGSDGVLSFHDIMPFLWECYLDRPNAIYVGFYLTYDFSQWFKSLPAERARMLYSEIGRAIRTPRSEHRHGIPFPVRFAGWEFDMMGGRRFKLRPEGSELPYMYICDAGSFWQTSLIRAIDPANWQASDPILTDRQFAEVAKGKSERATATLNETMVRYNRLENLALAKAMHYLERGFHAHGWDLKRSHFFGPGQVAQLWLNQIHAPTRTQIAKVTPKPVLEAARASYYGGRFEITAHGMIPGVLHEYDINSAYPDAISRLPCLLHGEWIHNGHEGYSLVKVRTTGSDSFLGGLPHRSRDGIIAYPRNVEGWYWLPEVESAYHAGLIDSYDIMESWQYMPCDCLPPMASIANLYNDRLHVGKNTVRGKAIKNCCNSAYGKFAQSVGSPKYANPIYASMITSDCRTRILNAIVTHPRGARDVMMIATDGIYFRTPHPNLTLSSDTLGAWDHATKHDATLFLPGIYWDDKARDDFEGTPTLKSRGINAVELAKHIEWIDLQFSGFTTHGIWPSVTLPVRFSVVSPSLALARNAWSTCGTISTYDRDGTVRELDSNPKTKRNTDWVQSNDLIRTMPYDDLGRNYGYERRFGMTIEAMLDNDIITDDGSVNMELRDLLGIGE